MYVLRVANGNQVVFVWFLWYLFYICCNTLNKHLFNVFFNLSSNSHMLISRLYLLLVSHFSKLRQILVLSSVKYSI